MERACCYDDVNIISLVFCSLINTYLPVTTAAVHPCSLTDSVTVVQ